MNSSSQHRHFGFGRRGARIRSGLLAAGILAWLLVSPLSRAQDAVTTFTHNLADLSLEELMNVAVTSVSKKETKLNDSPAAISVITQDDILRLGISTIPDAQAASVHQILTSGQHLLRLIDRILAVSKSQPDDLTCPDASDARQTLCPTYA